MFQAPLFQIKTSKVSPELAPTPALAPTAASQAGYLNSANIATMSGDDAGNLDFNPMISDNRVDTTDLVLVDINTTDEDSIAYEEQFAGPSEENRRAEEYYLSLIHRKVGNILADTDSTDNSGKLSLLLTIHVSDVELSEKAKERLFQMACTLGDEKYVAENAKPKYQINLSLANEAIINSITSGLLKDKVVMTQENIVKALTTPLTSYKTKNQLLDWIRNESFILDEKYIDRLFSEIGVITSEFNSVIKVLSLYQALDAKFKGHGNNKEQYIKALKSYFSLKTRNKMAIYFLIRLINNPDNFLRLGRKNTFLGIDVSEKNGLTNSFLDVFIFILNKLPETEFTSYEISRILRDLSSFMMKIINSSNYSGSNISFIEAAKHAFFKIKINVAPNQNTNIVKNIIDRIEATVLSHTGAIRETQRIRAQLNEGGLPWVLSMVSGQDDYTDNMIKWARTSILLEADLAIGHCIEGGTVDILSSKTAFNLLNSDHQRIMLKMAEISPDEFTNLISYLTQLKESDLMALERTLFFQQFGINPTRAVQEIDKIIDALKYGYYSFGKGHLVSIQSMAATPITPAPTAAPA